MCTLRSSIATAVEGEGIGLRPRRVGPVGAFVVSRPRFPGGRGDMTREVDLVDRLARARLAMAAAHVDVLLLSVGRDLLYLTGYEAPLLERLTMAVIPRDGSVTMFVPELEAPEVRRYPDVFDVRPWGETTDPVALVAAAAGEAGVAAIGDQTWAAFLLALQERMPRTRVCFGWAGQFVVASAQVRHGSGLVAGCGVGGGQRCCSARGNQVRRQDGSGPGP